MRERVPGSANRVNRGGGFNNLAVNARAANRNDDTPSNADDNLGLRPAKASLPARSRRPDPGRPPRRARDAQTRFLCRLLAGRTAPARPGLVAPERERPGLAPCLCQHGA